MKKAIPDTSKSNRSETQKLYRHVQQISQRLDLQLQQAMDWQEWFDVETLQLRQRVRDVCEHLLLSGECDIARKTEEYLWRKSFYDIIQAKLLRHLCSYVLKLCIIYQFIYY